MPDTPRISVRVRGTLRGTPIDTDGTVRLVEDAVFIQLDDREHSVRLDRIDGVVWDPPMLVVHHDRDTTELSGHAGLQTLGASITSSVLVLPELARTMHGLGSRRGGPDADHDRFFAGLLSARRAAEGFVEVESRLAAFDPRRLTQQLTTLLGELAVERYPESPPDRRALEAELLEHAERLFAAIEALGEAAVRVREGGDAMRLAQWRAWTRSAQRVFEEAGRCWVAILPALDAQSPPAPHRRFWRRAHLIALATSAALHAVATSGVAR